MDYSDSQKEAILLKVIEGTIDLSRSHGWSAEEPREPEAPFLG
jgi:hypothetical protein